MTYGWTCGSPTSDVVCQLTVGSRTVPQLNSAGVRYPKPAILRRWVAILGQMTLQGTAFYERNTTRLAITQGDAPGWQGDSDSDDAAAAGLRVESTGAGGSSLSQNPDTCLLVGEPDMDAVRSALLLLYEWWHAAASRDVDRLQAMAVGDQPLLWVTDQLAFDSAYFTRNESGLRPLRVYARGDTTWVEARVPQRRRMLFGHEVQECWLLATIPVGTATRVWHFSLFDTCFG
jgi:hypothetical protein